MNSTMSSWAMSGERRGGTLSVSLLWPIGGPPDLLTDLVAKLKSGKGKGLAPGGQ